MTVLLIIFLSLVVIILSIYQFYSLYAFIFGAPFVPVPKKMVAEIIRMANLKGGEFLMDLGSGDGRIILASAKKGVDCCGIEINPWLYLFSKFRLRHFQKAKIIRKNLWDIDLSQVDVLTLYFMQDKMGKLKEKIKKEMKPGSRVVSYAFTFPDWQFVDNNGKIHLYIV